MHNYVKFEPYNAYLNAQSKILSTNLFTLKMCCSGHPGTRLCTQGLTNQKFDSVSANVKAIICDGNRVIQASFKMYTFVPRHNDPLQAVINNPDDNRLNLILLFGDMALKMARPKGKRIKQLSKYTATCIHQTCYGLVDLCRYLLNTTQNYVLLGQFTPDHLEKEYLLYYILYIY